MRSTFWRLLPTGAHFRVRACTSPEPPKSETTRSLPLYIPAIGNNLIQMLYYSKVDRLQYQSCIPYQPLPNQLYLKTDSWLQFSVEKVELKLSATLCTDRCLDDELSVGIKPGIIYRTIPFTMR